MMRHAFHSLLYAAIIAAIGCSSHAAADARAPRPSAELSADTVAPDDSVTLSVSVDGTAGAPSIPTVRGLHIRPIGERSQMTVINGSAQRSTTYLYDVQADEPGDYVIDGMHAARQPIASLTLHVVQGASAPARHSDAISGRTSAPPDSDSGLASMRLRVDKQRLYAGEAVPFTIVAYFRGGTAVALNGRPQFGSDAFIVSGLDASPKQTQTSVGGVPYLAVTWRGVLSAVKPGDYSLDVKLPVSLQYRDSRPAARAPSSTSPSSRLRDLFGNAPGFDNLFDDPFFHSAFDEPLFDGMFDAGRVVNRDMTLHGSAGTARVLPLPAAGRPRDWAGAIGQFQLQAHMTDSKLSQGQPSELHVTLRGAGNFGQFSAPQVPNASGWNTYDPESKFTASDKLGLHGTAEYVEALTPERSGELQVPGLRFSYFDPDAQHYVTLTTAAIPVNVAASDTSSTVASTASAAPTPAAAPAGAEVSVGSLARGGVPGWLLPLTAAASLLAMLVCVVLLWLRSTRHEQRRLRAQTKRAFARKRREMQRAARAGDEAAFVRSSKQALAQRLAEAWSLDPEAVTLFELDRHWPGAPDDVRRVFERADEAEYAGGARRRSALEPSELVASARRLDNQLKHLEVPT